MTSPKMRRKWKRLRISVSGGRLLVNVGGKDYVAVTCQETDDGVVSITTAIYEYDHVAVWKRRSEVSVPASTASTTFSVKVRP